MSLSTNLCLFIPAEVMLKRFDESFDWIDIIECQKAFETINHKCFRKTESYQIFKPKHEIVCIISLWVNIFFVYRKPTFWNFGIISFGILLDSILLILIFLMYVRDMPQAVKYTSLEYADDFCLIYWHADVTNIDEKLNETIATGLLIIKLTLTLVIIILMVMIILFFYRKKSPGFF